MFIYLFFGFNAADGGHVCTLLSFFLVGNIPQPAKGTTASFNSVSSRRQRIPTPRRRTTTNEDGGCESRPLCLHSRRNGRFGTRETCLRVFHCMFNGTGKGTDGGCCCTLHGCFLSTRRGGLTARPPPTTCPLRHCPLPPSLSPLTGHRCRRRTLCHASRRVPDVCGVGVPPPLAPTASMPHPDNDEDD